MSRTENEQEFVLGNKQLLSAFFVVVALLGVFFVMGYIIGRNTGAADPSAKKGTSTEPAPVTSATNLPESMLPPPTAIPEAATPVQSEKPRPSRAEPEAEKPVEKVGKKPVETVAESRPAQVESSAGHTYLQVTALKRPSADNIVRVLKERDFPALLGESPKAGYFRVLVGPYSDAEKLSKAKTDIKKMGFEPQVMR